MRRATTPQTRPGSRLHVRAWLHHVRIAFDALVGRRTHDRTMLGLMRARPDLLASFADLQAEMPQADVADETLRQEYAPWREYFAAKLHGRGLEIGAHHRPLPTHAGTTITYLDYADVDTLKRTAPEISEPFAPVDIVDDAATLSTVPDASDDFVVAGHVIEHLRNPIAALGHWLRVVVPGGRVYLIVPDKRRTFDRPRVRTLLEHLILDYQAPSSERDFEHFLEYAVHVHRSSGEVAVDEARRLHATNFSIHFHTFLPKDLVALVQWMHAHVTPVSIVEGPVMSPHTDEFHLLLARPAR
jgi:SAM-dependent methyltransferase